MLLALLAGAVNAWFLLTDVVHAGDIQASQRLVPWSATSFLNTPGVLFDPLRAVPSLSGTPALYVQISLWFLAWAIVALIWLRLRPGNRMVWRAGVALGAVLAILLLLIMTPQPWDLMPAIMRNIQFAYRLNSYVALTIGGMVLVGIVGLQRSRRGAESIAARPRTDEVGEVWLSGGLVVAVLVSLGFALWQLWVPNDRMTGNLESYVNRHEALISPNVFPRTWYDTDSYADYSQRVVTVPPSRTFVIDPRLVGHDRISAMLDLPPGLEPIATNILAGPYLVSIHGVAWVGRTAGGFAVIRRTAPGVGPVHVVIQTAASPAIVGGRVISLMALVGLALLLVLTARRRRGSTRARETA